MTRRTPLARSSTQTVFEWMFPTTMRDPTRIRENSAPMESLASYGAVAAKKPTLRPDHALG